MAAAGTQVNTARHQADQAEEDAQAEREGGALRAAKIKRQGAAQRSQAISDLAAAGVNVGEGTALKIDQEIAARTNEDAMQEILYGSKRGQRFEDEARFRRRAGNYGAASSLLSSGAQVGRGWNGRGRPGGNIRIDE